MIACSFTSRTRVSINGQRGDDPPVFGRFEGRGRWAKERVTLSEHLILTCLFEAVMCQANYGTSAAWLDEDQLAAVVAEVPPIAIRPLAMGRHALLCRARRIRLRRRQPRG